MGLIREAWRSNEKELQAAQALLRAIVVVCCALSWPMSSLHAEDLLLPEDSGAGRVFGRVVLVEEGREREISAMLDVLRVRIRHAGSDQSQAIRLHGDGSFDWPLKPGDYIFQAIYFRNTTLRLWSSFTVPEAGNAAYVGDLRLAIDRGRMGVSLVDAYDSALKRGEAREAQAKLATAKALMQREPPLGSYARLLPICAKGWGIECSRSYQGVEPVQPDGAGQNFPVASSRSPLLEWKPSSDPEVTYDIAIHEVLDPGPFEGRKERGRPVAYAQALAEPRYQPEAPLAAGRKFMWSVRLRKGDAVSSWSTSSYFAFFVVAWASGSGQWFGFETPVR